ncbi:DUF952 domain-containing protein [Mycoplasmatota bacterium WC44]
MITHIIKRSEWIRAREVGIYVPCSLEKDGFIHCSTIEKTVAVANYNYKNENGLVLLCIDELKIDSEVRYEDLYELNYEYPHIYGPLNLSSVIDVITFEANEDGYFELPDKLKTS